MILFHNTIPLIRNDLIWKQFRGGGYLWHLTSLDSLLGILSDGNIMPNSGQIKPVYSQSRISYAWHLNSISLFDFESGDEEWIIQNMSSWEPVFYKHGPTGVAIRILRDTCDPEKLIRPLDIKNRDHRLDNLPDHIKAGLMVLQAVEALHIGPIPVSLIDGFMWMARESGGSYLLHEVAADRNAIGVLQKLSSQYRKAESRSRRARHLRGEFTLAELISMS